MTNLHGSLGIRHGGQMGAFPWPGPRSTQALTGSSQIPQDLAVSSAHPLPSGHSDLESPVGVQ